MTKKVLNNLTADKVIENLKKIAASEAVMCGCDNIETDMNIDLHGDMGEWIANGFCHAPEEWFVAVREGGVESDTHLEAVIARCRALGMPHLTIQVKKYATDNFTMIINR